MFETGSDLSIFFTPKKENLKFLSSQYKGFFISFFFMKSHPSDNHNSGLLYPSLLINSNHSLFDTKSILSSKGQISTEFEGDSLS